MFIKKVGYLLLIRLKLFKIAAKISPLLIIASLFILFFTTHLKEEYKFQQPSLRTKIYDIQQKHSTRPLKYREIMPGIKFLQIQGLLENQCILLTFPVTSSQSNQIKCIYQTLKNDNHNSKNIILLSYSDSNTFKDFFKWYYNPKQNMQMSFGIIRVGLNIEVEQIKYINTTQNIDKGIRKDKAYFKIYTTSLHPDLDYFQSIKQLLEKLQITWSPCQQIHKANIISTIKKNILILQQYIDKQSHLRLFIDHVLCEFKEHISSHVSPHQVMMENGFQSGTIKFMVGPNQNKIQKLVVSFIKEFSMQQDHLHSANTLYYPLTRSHFVPMLYTLYPSLIFFLALVILLIDGFITTDYKGSFSIRIEIAFIAYFLLTEYYLTNHYHITMIVAIFLYIATIFYQFNLLFSDKHQSEEINRNYYEISFIAISGLISIYFGVFCFSLSYLSILLTILMLLKPKRPIKIIIVKLMYLCLAIYYIQCPNIDQFKVIVEDVSRMSAPIKLCLILPLFHYSF